MKKTLILVIIVIVIVCIVGIARESKQAVQIPSVPSTPVAQSDFCYYRADKTASGFYDRAWLRMHVDGSAVTGEFNNYPAEKDSKTGTFVGTVAEDVASLVWNTMAEGMTAKEELLVKFDDTQAQAAFGEMVQGANGVYVYKDRNSAVYQVPMPVIDCKNLDEIIAVEKYVRSTDLAVLTKTKATLGGSLFVSSIVVDPATHTATVSYEDGHNSYKGVVAYAYNTASKTVTVNSFEAAH